MDTDVGMTYALLVIPGLFAGAVTIQGIAKMAKHEHGGPVVLGFGIVFCILIIAAYFLFIR